MATDEPSREQLARQDERAGDSPTQSSHGDAHGDVAAEDSSPEPQYQFAWMADHELIDRAVETLRMDREDFDAPPYKPVAPPPKETAIIPVSVHPHGRRAAKNRRVEQPSGERTGESRELVDDEAPGSSPTGGINAFLAPRAVRHVRAVVEDFHLALVEHDHGAGSPPDVDSQCTVMDELTLLHEGAKRLPMLMDLVIWDHLDRLRLWYRTRKPRQDDDVFQIGTAADGHAWVAFGLRPRNWRDMHSREHYPWLNLVTVEHFRQARLVPPLKEGGVRPYDSTGLRCSVEFWCGIDDTNHLLQLEGTRDRSSPAHAYFISLFWKYRMALRKGKALEGRALAQSWASFHATMKSRPEDVYAEIEDFYTNTIDGTLIRIHEVSRNHGIGCAVPVNKGVVCPMCTRQTPKLPDSCRTQFFDLVPLEVKFYLAQLDGLLESEARKKKRRVDV